MNYYDNKNELPDISDTDVPWTLILGLLLFIGLLKWCA